MQVAPAFEHSDRWICWPTASTVGVTVAVVLFGGMPGPLSVLLPLLAIIVLPVVTLLLIGWACVLLFRQLSRKAASALLAVAVPALLLIPIAFAQPYVHLGLMLAFGIGYIGPTPETGQRVGIYDWSTGLAGGPSTFLVHDTTDAIASPETRDVSAWRNDEFLKDCAATARHLIGHYYVCDI